MASIESLGRTQYNLRDALWSLITRLHAGGVPQGSVWGRYHSFRTLSPHTTD